MTWHIYNNKSIIQESLNAIKSKSDCFIIDIFTENDGFFVTEADDFVIGADFLTIITENDDDGILIYIINANKIESIRMKSYKNTENVAK